MTNHKLGIISATENEINSFLDKLSDSTTETRAMLKFHVGRYYEKDIVALYCGVCKVNAAIAAQILITHYSVSKIIMIGAAGAIDEKLEICDTVIADQIAYHDVSSQILTEYHPYMEKPYFKADHQLVRGIMSANANDKTVLSGKVVTGESFIDQEGRDDIIRKHAPLCVDMETASVAHVCYVNDIPFTAIRTISDTPHESGDDAFRKYGSSAAEKAIEVLDHYLKNGFFCKASVSSKD